VDLNQELVAEILMINHLQGHQLRCVESDQIIHIHRSRALLGLQLLLPQYLLKLLHMCLKLLCVCFHPSGIITSPRRDLLTHAQDATTHPDYPISEMLIQSLPHGQYALLLTHPVAVGDYRDLIRLLLSVFKLLPSFHDDSPLSRRLMYFELHNHLILLLGGESHCIKRGFAWG
jgi:hypothetical protein